MTKEIYSVKIYPSQTKNKWNYTEINNLGTENHYNTNRKDLEDLLKDLIINIRGVDYEGV